MRYSIQRLQSVRVAVVLVERKLLARAFSDKLIAELQMQFQYPVMLVSADQTHWTNANAVAQFDAAPYLFDLLAQRDDIEWHDVPAPVEPELPSEQSRLVMFGENCTLHGKLYFGMRYGTHRCPCGVAHASYYVP